MAAHPDFAAALAGLAEFLRRSTVRVDGPRSGSGVVWRASGLIVTNAHVATGQRALVTLAGGREFEAAVVARDPRRDLAALAVNASGLPAAAIGESDALRPGELLFAAGNPLGLTGALAAGVALSGGAAEWIRADIPLAPGNSGGPLADAGGRVVGINSMVAGGVALAVPSRAVEAFLRRAVPFREAA
jgi:serine protease Do